MGCVGELTPPCVNLFHDSVAAGADIGIECAYVLWRFNHFCNLREREEREREGGGDRGSGEGRERESMT